MYRVVNRPSLYKLAMVLYNSSHSHSGRQTHTHARTHTRINTHTHTHARCKNYKNKRVLCIYINLTWLYED